MLGTSVIYTSSVLRQKKKSMTRFVLNLALTLFWGFAIALGIGWLVGLLWPSAFLPVTLIISAWWAWTGWKYAVVRNRLAAMPRDSSAQ
jgi:hypothetical protein